MRLRVRACRRCVLKRGVGLPEGIGPWSPTRETPETTAIETQHYNPACHSHYNGTRNPVCNHIIVFNTIP